MVKISKIVGQIGIGIDIEENQRFVKLIDDGGFLKKVYTPSELKYCLAKARPEQHLAARFAAKEALIKALNQLGYKKINHHDIELVSDGKNAPVIKIKNNKELIIKASLSHSNIESVAVVIVIKN